MSLDQTPKVQLRMQPRRGKRDKRPLQRKTVRKASKKSEKSGPEALLPSLAGLAVLVLGVMAQMGFRGRASVAGIDLGTTNSVICVQKLVKGVGEIECIPDGDSVIVPSVVSFGDRIIVGSEAKNRIDSYPHSTVYQAKRVLGRSYDDASVADLQAEVEFSVEKSDEDGSGVVFAVNSERITPETVGSLVVKHLLKITDKFLGHDNVRSAVICVPAKFDARQRQATVQAFKDAGVAVQRIVEEPTAAALAYGLQHKESVDYILVYDFGGGTLDVSLLQVSGAGFVDVLGSDGDDRLGGADFDAAVAHYLMEKHKSVVDRIQSHDSLLEEGACSTEVPLCTSSSFHTIGEQLKIALSSSNQESVSSQCLALKDEMVPEKSNLCKHLEPLNLDLSLSAYEQAADPLFARSVAPIHRLLKDFQLTSSDIDEVVMVGGTTRMPQIRQLVQKALPDSQVNTRIDPDITVAYGAASVID